MGVGMGMGMGGEMLRSGRKATTVARLRLPHRHILGGLLKLDRIQPQLQSRDWSILHRALLCRGRCKDIQEYHRVGKGSIHLICISRDGD